MKNTISLENIDNFVISFDQVHTNRFIFEDKNGNIPLEVQDQVLPLNDEVVIFLRKFEETQKILSHYPSKKYFKTIEEFRFSVLNEEKIKEWLYKRGISFDHQVIWRDGTTAFLMSWKMIIRFSDDILVGKDGLIWDKTLNWTLGFEHNGILFWGKDRIYNNEIQFKEIEVINKLIQSNRI
jgi:hypothetical protein